MTRCIALLLAVLVLLAPGPMRAQEPPDPPFEETTLALPAVSLTHAATYLAHDLGLFRMEGLDVKLLDIAGAGAGSAVLAGRSDFTVMTASTLARAAVSGERLWAIAGLLNRPMMEVVLRTSLPNVMEYDAQAPLEDRARLLKGRNIAIEGSDSDPHAYLMLLARRAGLDPAKDLRIVQMPAVAMPAALAAARIDGFVASPPWTTGAVSGGSAILIASAPNGALPDMLPFASSLLVTRPQVCELRRSVCEKILRAYLLASRVIRLNKPWALDNLKRRFGTVPDDVLATALDIVSQGTPRTPIVSVIGIENSELFNVSAGVLKLEDTLRDYDAIYSNEFVR
jgi:NitT/TauT family transport system substrate-binding protein